MNQPYYNTQRAVSEYLLFHYGTDAEVLPWGFGPTSSLQFPVRCVTECLALDRLPPNARALDLGCAVGRSAFELARHCPQVVALDFSAPFIHAARAIQTDGQLEYDMTLEGTRTRRVTARLPEGVDPGRVTFAVGDALSLPSDLGTFDVVLAANLLDRVASPRRLLEVLAERVKPAGQLILTSPYTWTPEYTEPREWLCVEDRETFTTLQELLPTFCNLRRLDLPFLIREHARKFQWSVAEATTWLHVPVGTGRSSG